MIRLLLALLCLTSVAADRPISQQTFSPLQRERGGSVRLVGGDYYKPAAGVEVIVVKNASGILDLNGATIGVALHFQSCANLTIKDGKLDGRRREFGDKWNRHLIVLADCTNVIVQNVTADNARGDGAYICERSEWCVLDGFRVTDAYRNGISVIDARRLLIDRSRVIGARGTPQSCGIDVEANADDPPEANQDITIRGTTVGDVSNIGIYAPRPQPGHRPQRITIDRCDIDGWLVLHGDDHRVTNSRVRGGEIRVRGQRPRVDGCDVTGWNLAAVYLAGPGWMQSGNRAGPGPTTQAVRIEDVE